MALADVSRETLTAVEYWRRRVLVPGLRIHSVRLISIIVVEHVEQQRPEDPC